VPVAMTWVNSTVVVCETGFDQLIRRACRHCTANGLVNARKVAGAQVIDVCLDCRALIERDKVLPVLVPDDGLSAYPDSFSHAALKRMIRRPARIRAPNERRRQGRY